MGGGVSTDFKSSNRIEISWLVQVLLNFYWFWGSPWAVGGGWMGMGVVRGCPHTCAYAHACMYVHAHMCTYDIIGNPQDFPKSNGGGHLHEIIMFTMHACVCACVCACACVWGAPPNHHPPPSTHPPTPHPPEPQGAQITKITKTLELIKIIRFCLKILYLWIF